MFRSKTNIELVNRAFQAIRISGLTTDAVPEESSMALSMLEDMMRELDSRNICTGYIYADEIDPNEESGIPPYANNAASMNLASRIINFFGREVPVGIAKMATGGIDNWSSRTAKVNKISPPANQPRGSGSTLRFPNWNRYYGNLVSAPLECSTLDLGVGDTNFFTVDFVSYLDEGETIDSYEVEISRGIDILSITQIGTAFEIKAQGLFIGYSPVNLIITTSLTRVNNEVINFNIVP